MATKAQTQARKPSKAVVTKPLAQLAASVTKGAAKPVQAPATNMVALRGQQAVTNVQIKAGTVYRTKAQHNLDWWAIVTKHATAKAASVADLTKAGVPAHFIGYSLRRGYLTPSA